MDGCENFQEIYREFAMASDDGFWIAELTKPMSAQVPGDEQVEHLFQYAVIVECNQAFAEMYGFGSPRELEGKPILGFLNREDEKNIEAVKGFLKSGYKVEGVETHELDKDNIPHSFVNYATGIVENGHLERIWGMQRDITDQILSKQMRNQLLAMLTPREREILKLTAGELSIKQIAAALKISADTVKVHRKRMIRRLDIHNLAGLVLLAMRLGLVCQME